MWRGRCVAVAGVELFEVLPFIGLSFVSVDRSLRYSIPAKMTRPPPSAAPERRRQAHRCRRGGNFTGMPANFTLPAVDGRLPPPCRDGAPGRGENLIDGLHGGQGTSPRERSDPFGGGAREKDFGEKSDQRLAIFDAIWILGEARIIGKIGSAEGKAEALPNVFAGGAQDQKTVSRRKTLIGHDGRMGVAPASGNLTADQIIAAGVDQRGDLGFEQRVRVF